MFYKHKIFFDIESAELLNKDWDDTVVLCLESNITDVYKLITTVVVMKNVAFVSISVANMVDFFKHTEIKHKINFDTKQLKRSFSNICKNYELRYEDDIFIIKICSKNTITQIKLNNYTEYDVVNELKGADFKNDIELIDACLYVLYHDTNEQIKDLFITKALYLGYPELIEILASKTVNDISNDILNTETTTLTDIKNKFYKMAMLVLQYKSIETDKFLYGELEADYNKIIDYRLNDLKKYPLLYTEKKYI